MFNPNMFMKAQYPQAQRNIPIGNNISLDKLTGYERSRWDEPIQVPNILYQKFKINPPQNQISEKQVNNNYPPSLIDFINRAYSRCKDQNEKKLIQAELREIIDRQSNNLFAVNWQSYPLPNIITQETTQKTSVGQVSNPNFTALHRPNIIQKQIITLPNLYNQSLIDKIQKPNTQVESKVKSILEKKLQKLEQKYGQQKPEGQKSNVPEKTFIGFKNEREMLMEQQKLRYEQLHQKKKVSDSKNVPRQKQEPLKVIQSRQPERMPQPRHPEPKIQKKQQKIQKITKKQLQTISKATQNKDELKTVAKRFAEFNKIKQVKVDIQQQNEQVDDIDYNIIGKCKKIDKPYLRITHRPDPQTVRPQSVLRKAFNHYKSQYQKGVTYDIIISQFKSIRQDLTVQNIRNSFTVQVYEQNLKISLYEDDVIQLKQCQTNLWELYRQGLYNKRTDRTKFISYHFISMILRERYKQLQYLLSLIPEDVLQEKQIQDSLKLKRYLILGNYKAFFDFVSAQDNMGQKLMGQFIDKVRVKCLVMVCKTFGQKVKLSQLAENIGEDDDILANTARQEGAVIVDDCLMLKQSYEALKNSEHLKIKKVTSLLD